MRAAAVKMRLRARRETTDDEPMYRDPTVSRVIVQRLRCHASSPTAVSLKTARRLCNYLQACVTHCGVGDSVLYALPAAMLLLQLLMLWRVPSSMFQYTDHPQVRARDE